VIDRNVHALAAAGTTFSLDDYGAGYSNVTRALRLPFSLIKFDKSFVDALDDTATRTVLEQSIAMMRSIGKCVLVEGVETQEQADALRAMGVDYIQGYRYAKPLAEDEFVDFLLAHNQSAGA
jgi:EAL domain-containing protein (putative c-di-GMP-specific phosphodiesterase class I)